MAEKNLTKKEILLAVRDLMEQDIESMISDTVSAEDVIDYIDTTIAQIDHKNEKAKERAQKRKADGDATRDKIESILTDEFKTIQDIINEIGDEDLTPGKVSARMGQLCKLDKAHRTKVKRGDRQITAYAAGPEPENEVEPEDIAD